MPTTARPDVPDAPAGDEPNLYVAWFEARRAEQDARREGAAAAKLRMRREIRWMAGALAVWAVLAALSDVL